MRSESLNVSSGAPVTVLIEANPPGSWQDLEARVAQILTECGYEVERQKNIPLARGDVNIDVWADDHSSPQNIIVVECKHWATPVTKSVVHSFRTVVGDSGANTGLIVSSAGFQKGAVEAAAYSNVRLLDWTEFQTMFAVRWFRQYMSSTLEEQTDALHEYTEAMNSRILRKAGALSPDKQEQFRVLRERYFPLALSNFAFFPGNLEFLLPVNESPLPSLPLRVSRQWPHGRELESLVPDDVLDATALRPLMDALIEHSRRAIAEFDELFGERA
jgi:restriction system protein